MPPTHNQNPKGMRRAASRRSKRRSGARKDRVRGNRLRPTPKATREVPMPSTVRAVTRFSAPAMARPTARRAVRPELASMTAVMAPNRPPAWSMELTAPLRAVARTPRSARTRREGSDSPRTWAERGAARRIPATTRAPAAIALSQKKARPREAASAGSSRQTSAIRLTPASERPRSAIDPATPEAEARTAKTAKASGPRERAMRILATRPRASRAALPVATTAQPRVTGSM